MILELMRHNSHVTFRMNCLREAFLLCLINFSLSFFAALKWRQDKWHVFAVFACGRFVSPGIPRNKTLSGWRYYVTLTLSFTHTTSFNALILRDNITRNWDGLVNFYVNPSGIEGSRCWYKSSSNYPFIRVTIVFSFWLQDVEWQLFAACLYHAHS